MLEYSKEFRRLRKEMQLTQAALAAELGVTVTTVARWECRAYPVSEMTIRHMRLLRGRKDGRIREVSQRGF